MNLDKKGFEYLSSLWQGNSIRTPVCISTGSSYSTMNLSNWVNTLHEMYFTKINEYKSPKDLYTLLKNNKNKPIILYDYNMFTDDVVDIMIQLAGNDLVKTIKYEEDSFKTFSSVLVVSEKAPRNVILIDKYKFHEYDFR